MARYRILALTAVLAACLTGCSEEKKTDPKISGAEDPNLKRAGAGAGPGASGKPATGPVTSGAVGKD